MRFLSKTMGPLLNKRTTRSMAWTTSGFNLGLLGFLLVHGILGIRPLAKKGGARHGFLGVR